MIEIERKYLVRDTSILDDAVGVPYRQGYIAAEGATVRVRIAGEQGYLTIKGRSTGISRAEFEYRIPLVDAREMLDTLCLKEQIEKTRYRIDHAGHTWEVDVFHGANSGLLLAEIELTDAAQTPPLPPWIGKEVSTDPRYYNSYLAAHPFTTWRHGDSD